MRVADYLLPAKMRKKRFHETAVDSRLATDLLLMCRRRAIDVAVIATEDSDIVPTIAHCRDRSTARIMSCGFRRFVPLPPRPEPSHPPAARRRRSLPQPKRELSGSLPVESSTRDSATAAAAEIDYDIFTFTVDYFLRHRLDSPTQPPYEH